MWGMLRGHAEMRGFSSSGFMSPRGRVGSSVCEVGVWLGSGLVFGTVKDWWGEPFRGCGGRGGLLGSGVTLSSRFCD